MLARLKRLIGIRDHVDIVSAEVVDIIKRYQRFSESERQEVISAFGYAKAHLESEHGNIHTWKLKHKGAVADYLLKTAKAAYASAPYSSSGVALVGLYLEAQTLRGAKAKRLVHLLDNWYRRSAIEDRTPDSRAVNPT